MLVSIYLCDVSGWSVLSPLDASISTSKIMGAVIAVVATVPFPWMLC